jgi:hypothetical protein
VSIKFDRNEDGTCVSECDVCNVATISGTHDDATDKALLEARWVALESQPRPARHLPRLPQEGPLMTALTDYQPKHAGGWYDPEPHVDYDPRHGADDLAARLVRDLNNPMPCRRCDDAPDSPRTCAACLAEIQMREDDESHANECARYEARWSALGDDERGDL